MTEINWKKELEEGEDGLFMHSLRHHAWIHKDNVQKEYWRIEDKRKEEQWIQKEKEEAKWLWREARAAAWERRWITELRNKIVNEVVNTAHVADVFKADIHWVFDVRDPVHWDGGIFIIGGFVAELLITFNCLNDYILANPSNQNF